MTSFEENVKLSSASDRIAYITMITSDSYLPGVQALVKVSIAVDIIVIQSLTLMSH